MTFDNDEEIYGIQTSAAGFENEVTVGSTKVKIINVPNAQPEEKILKVLVELTGKGKPIERSGLDLVIVLDISQHMNRQDRLEKVKKATEFVITKLSPVDRVSIVTFAQVANKLCPLRQINKGSKKDILDLVNGVITCADGANLSDGLEMALQVLSGRKFTEDRSVGVILMSSGEQDGGRNAAEAEMGKVPVYTFGFGIGSKDNLTQPHVLDAIARNSAGGTYADVQNGDDLSVAFAQCFTGLLRVAVQDLKLVLSPENMSTVENVYGGDHEQTRDDSLVSVMLGNLYDKETRKVLVHILPPDTRVVGLQVLKVSYKYRNEVGKERKSTPLYASKKHIQNFTQEEIEDLMAEVTHLESAHMINEGRSSEVVPYGNMENLPLSTTPCTDQDDLKEDTIKSILDVATDGQLMGERPLSSTPCMDTDKKQENLGTKGHVGELPLYTQHMNTRKKLAGEAFHKDYINPLPTNLGNVKKETTPPSSDVATNCEIENSPLNSPRCTNKDDLNDKIVTPSSKVTVRGVMEKVLFFFTKLLCFFNLYSDKYEKHSENPLPAENENVKIKTTPPSSEGW